MAVEEFILFQEMLGVTSLRAKAFQAYSIDLDLFYQLHK